MSASARTRRRRRRGGWNNAETFNVTLELEAGILKPTQALGGICFVMEENEKSRSDSGTS
jgi:hypothetical protein